MAKIIPGPMVGQISGSIGATTFSRNRYGLYTRRRTNPTNPNTIYQQEARSYLATASSAFAALTTAQKLAWEGFAKANPVTDNLGQTVTLAPNAAYVMLNSRLLRLGESQLTTPPIVPAPTGLTSLTLTADIGAGNVEVAYTSTPLGADDHLAVWAAVCPSPGVNYVKNLLKLVQVSAAAQASPLDIETAVTARFGTLAVGMTVHVQCQVWNDATGLASVALRDSVLVTTT